VRQAHISPVWYHEWHGVGADITQLSAHIPTYHRERLCWWISAAAGLIQGSSTVVIESQALVRSMEIIYTDPDDAHGTILSGIMSEWVSRPTWKHHLGKDLMKMDECASQRWLTVRCNGACRSSQRRGLPSVWTCHYYPWYTETLSSCRNNAAQRRTSYLPPSS